ncbi:glycosyltransferase family 4 protein [Candidatus Oscillochloris fontis]|uniref:glycosyltransferase family 4 protein n=1 Tax=Candidatus Oscillochloris fontis TaxID=2496868 RepID=UPI00101DF5B9|nr:glycosyltransferase family 1 protein [Candidatus Oscillochloris fontis]
MIIGVDYTAAAWQGAGIGRYTRELFAATIPRDHSLRYVLFYAARGLPAHSPYLRALADLCAANPNVQVRPIPISPRLLTILWQRLRLPLPVEHWVGKLDILHAPDFVLPPTRARALLTVHDLTFMVRPETADAGLRRYLEVAVPRSLRRADLVLADSQATRADLQRLLGVSPDRVRVLYPGVNPRFHPMPPEAVEPIRAQLGLPASFLLFVGTLEPRKNLVRLIEAFGALGAAGAYPDLHLVIAGRRGWLYKEIFATVTRLSLHERIRFLDFVDDAHLPAVYNLARAFIYPSLYEGFGLPVLEALACGTPVVTANTSSLPEVVGTAAILVDSHDPQAIAAGVQQALAHSSELRTAGPPQAASFRWETAAEHVIDIYHALAKPRL